MAKMPRVTSASQRGFTLIEIIVGLVTLTASFVILTLMILPQAQRSAEPVLQARAAALGKALLDEISGRSFDENSDRVGGLIRCGEAGTSCTAAGSLGPESGELRPNFNDVDDYNGLVSCESPGVPVGCSDLVDALGNEIADVYRNFQYSVEVCYSDPVGLCQTDITDFKLIKVTITTPLGQEFVFSSLRGNF
ncbi:type IV pilus modification PilV family protein [Aliidiomarina haloalkalitolerans]|uniref:Agglutinin biogenesis protein MshD n=1 Tax=Aliidiomarina haloalkalitolerans TaxID=859059 RepID=A0A432VSN6_9GAMM|nr:prepilin-type N-terminal cleavage/methylation domain-containing protein [Aliidiomarina haloalkalitolerans]RUO19429.1 hypothetical protein CWE06_07800 [Aliidiomarina haloalkalitolerans]